MMDSATRDRLQALWQEVARFSFLQSDQAMQHFLKETGKLLGVASATWIGSTRNKDVSAVPAMEMIDDWFVIDLMNVELAPCPLSIEEQYGLYFQLVQAHGLDPLTARAVEGAGELRGIMRSDIYDADQWAAHWHFTEYLKPMGMSEGMVIGLPLGPECESYVTYQMGAGSPPFSAEDKALAMAASAGIASLHRRLMFLRGAWREHGKLLSPQERVVLGQLLGGTREKEMAAKLEISASTIHAHVSAIYRKFGVSGKTGLFAQLVSG